MTSSRPKHPALAVQDFTQRIETMDQRDLESLAGWDSFTPDQKRTFRQKVRFLSAFLPKQKAPFYKKGAILCSN